MELQTHTDTAYRQLLPTEIRQLEQQGCTAENWQLIEVHPDIDLRHLAYVHFSGSNRIGNCRAESRSIRVSAMPRCTVPPWATTV